MYIIRPIESRDVEHFVKIAFDALLGMTSMPKNRERLTQRIEKAIASFQKDVKAPGDEFYLFVLENLETGDIGGTSGIFAQAGRDHPLFFFRIEKKEKHEDIEHAITKIATMRAVQYRHYWSEIGSLYLAPEFRGAGSGRLLSLSRFLFMANQPHRFSKSIFAEMRGYILHKHSPFWEGIGHHFIKTDFYTLMQLRDEGQVDLTQVLPAHPIYIDLLPKEVQECIGRVHENTEPALSMLLKEGFVFSHEIDVCDGGPKIDAELREIRSVKESKTDSVAEIVSTIEEKPVNILATASSEFRACLARVTEKENGGVVISKPVAEALHINVGDSVRYVPASPTQRQSHG